MKGMVAGKWSDNAISSLEYKLEKQKRTNQSEQSTFWVPNRTSDFRLTGEYPDWSRPSLSVKMPDVLQQNTVYSFMDIVKKNLKNGETESSSTLLVDRPVITGRPVYLPEGPVSVPFPTTTMPTPPSTTTASSGKPLVTIVVIYKRLLFFLHLIKFILKGNLCIQCTRLYHNEHLIIIRIFIRSPIFCTSQEKSFRVFHT